VISRTVTILNKTGLHARPAGLFVETANGFRSAIKVLKGAKEADARSLLGLMLLEVTPGTEIAIQAHGDDETEAVAALASLVESRFGEAPPTSDS